MTAQQAAELADALQDVKGGVALLALLMVANLAILAGLGLLGMFTAALVVKQLNACWAILSISRGWTVLTERRRDDAAMTLQRIERIVVPAYSSASVVADESGAIVEWDAGAVALFHWTRDEAVGKPLTLLTPERFAPRHLAKFREAVAARRLPAPGLTLTGAAVTKEGREVGVTIRLSGWEADGRLFYRAQIEPDGVR